MTISSKKKPKKNNNKKKTNKLSGGGGNNKKLKEPNHQEPLCKSVIIDQPKQLKLSDLFVKSKNCAIATLITFQGITLKIEISENSIIFKLGENENMYCITLSFKKNNSKLEDYFLNNVKSKCIVNLQKTLTKDAVNKLFFDLFDAINIEMDVKIFSLEDSSKLILKRCNYELSLLKMIESGYGFYNKFGFFNKIEINDMNTLLSELKQQSIMNINIFFEQISYSKLVTKEDFNNSIRFLYIKYLILKSEYKKYLILKPKEQEEEYTIFSNSTTMSELCNYILQICNQTEEQSQESYNNTTTNNIKNTSNVKLKKVIDTIIFAIKMIIQNKILKTKGIKITDLQKIYDNNTMSSFNIDEKKFEMIPSKKYNFVIEYINPSKSKLSNIKPIKSNEYNESNEPIYHITIS